VSPIGSLAITGLASGSAESLLEAVRLAEQGCPVPARAARGAARGDRQLVDFLVVIARLPREHATLRIAARAALFGAGLLSAGLGVLIEPDVGAACSAVNANRGFGSDRPREMLMRRACAPRAQGRATLARCCPLQMRCRSSSPTGGRASTNEQLKIIEPLTIRRSTAGAHPTPSSRDPIVARPRLLRARPTETCWGPIRRTGVRDDRH
jgi:hypothetical protein